MWSIHWSLYKLCIYDLNSNYLKHLNKSNSSLFHQVKSRTNKYQYKLDLPPQPPLDESLKTLRTVASQLYILLHTKKKLEWGCTETINSSHALNCHYNTSNKLISRHCLDYKWLRFRINHTDCLCMWFV